MNLVYLGLFEKVFNWVLDKIMEPVYKFVSSLLTTVLTWAFQKVLAPVLIPVLEDILKFAIDLWKTIMSVRLYILFSGVLKLVDYLQTAFDVFIGIKDVTYKDASGNVISGSLLEVLFQQNTISTVFWAMTIGALGLALILTVYATAKSAFDLDFENRRPVSKVLASMMKTFVQFFTVPFLVYFLIKLAAVILRGVTNVLSFGTETTLGRIVFVIASLDAAKNKAYNVSTASGGITLGTSSADEIRYPFYSLSGGGSGVKDYGNLSEVSEVFNLADFDYLIGFIAAVFLLFTIGVCLLVFVQRIFEVMLLYLVSPYFVCTMPLDDGEKFAKWREMFVGKCFTGFGSVIGMRLYLMICPMVMGNTIRFGSGVSPEMDYIMKLFFLVGGAWAVYKSGSMITSLLSFQAGQSENMTAALAGGVLFSQTAGRLMGVGQRLIAGGLRGGRAGGSGREALPGAAAGKDQKDGQLFQGSKAGVAVGGLGAAAGLQKAMGGKALAGKGGLAGGIGGLGGRTSMSGKALAGRRSTISGGIGVSPGRLSEKGAAGARRNTISGGIGVSPGRLSVSGAAGARRNTISGGVGVSPGRLSESGAARMRSNAVSMGSRTGGAPGGLGLSGLERPGSLSGAGAGERQAFTGSENQARHHNLELGSLFRNTYDEQGNRTFRMLGFGFTANAEGKTNSVTLPCMSLQRGGEKGKFFVSDARLPGIANMHANVEGGRLKFSELNVLGMHCRSEDGASSVSFGGAFSLGRAKDGSVSHVKVGGLQVTNDENGVGFDAGRHFGVHSHAEGVSVGFGNSIKVETKRGHGLDSLQVGGIRYSRGKTITKQPGQTEQNKSGGKKA